MSKIKNGLNLHGAEPFEQQQFGTAGAEWVNGHRLYDGLRLDYRLVSSSILIARCLCGGIIIIIIIFISV